MKVIAKALVISSAITLIPCTCGCNNSSEVNDAYQRGYESGKINGYNTGYEEGYDVGYSNGKYETIGSTNSYHSGASAYSNPNNYGYHKNSTGKIVDCQACGGSGENSYEEEGRTCTVCNGKGKMAESEMLNRYNNWKKKVITCKLCNGTGLSYEARVTGFTNMDLLAPPGYYNCKVCKGKRKGTRAELIENFRVAEQVYGPNL